MWLNQKVWKGKLRGSNAGHLCRWNERLTAQLKRQENSFSSCQNKQLGSNSATQQSNVTPMYCVLLLYYKQTNITLLLSSSYNLQLDFFIIKSVILSYQTVDSAAWNALFSLNHNVLIALVIVAVKI